MNSNQALGRTIADLEPFTSPPKEIFPANGKMKAAQAIPEILSILAGVDRKYHSVIFETIVNLEFAEKGSEKTVEEIGRDLSILAKERREREIETKNKKTWFFRK